MNHVFDFDHPHSLDPAERTALLGGKGANLAVMVSELGLPVPPGFTISTEACRAFFEGDWPDGLDDEIRDHMRNLEARVERRFGGPGDPLLVSVRSGAPRSMPGMMDTILNLGLNAEVIEFLAEASGDRAFTTACAERFEAMYRDVVRVDTVPTDPWEQLRAAVEAVFRSWNSPRARTYREHEGIPEDLGTAVNVQAMVFGNWGEESATGVVFTRNPATGERGLYGDIMFQAQGEDVVAGTHTPDHITSLRDRMPAVADELERISDILERHYRDVCDIEFTIERGKLWILQTRIGKRTPVAALRVACEMADDPDFPLTREEAVHRVAALLVDPPLDVGTLTTDVPQIATGLGASPGLASGKIATTPDRAMEMVEAGDRVILVRVETSPDDVHGMARASGILTTRGGLTSHAAVVARGWGIPAVVGATAVEVTNGSAVIGGRVFAEGADLTINGSTGEIFAGLVDSDPTPIAEAATLLGWADELGIRISPVDERSDQQMTKETGRAVGPGPSEDAVIRALAIKGFAAPDLLAPAVLTTEEGLAPVMRSLADAGLVFEAASMWQLTDAGKAKGAELMAADREHWGPEAANAALDRFIPLDGKMKDIVTAWQMRDVDGEQVLNDHSDAEYDQAVLADLAAMQEEASAWLGSIIEGLPRLADYLTRLEEAAECTAAGEHAYIASPRVDSYHSIWFELHEDLIHLAGRTREEEMEAGRA